jgi:hypothetical protein
MDDERRDFDRRELRPEVERTKAAHDRAVDVRKVSQRCGRRRAEIPAHARGSDCVDNL